MRVTRWRPGSDHGLAWPGGIALVDGAVDAALAEVLWEALAAGADLAAFLDTLTRTSGRGLIDLPGFAIAFTAPDATIVAARGDFGVDLDTESGTEHVDGAGTSIWAERQLPAAAALALARRSASLSPGSLPIASGVVPAAGLVWTRAGRDATPAGQAHPPCAAPGERPGEPEPAGADRDETAPVRPGTEAAGQPAPAPPEQLAPPEPGEGGITLEPDWERSAPDLPRRLWLVPEPAGQPAAPAAAAQHAAAELARAVHHPSVGMAPPAAEAAGEADGFISVVPDFPRPAAAPSPPAAPVAIESVPAQARSPLPRDAAPTTAAPPSAPTDPVGPVAARVDPGWPADATTFAADDGAAGATRMRAEITSPVQLVPGRESPAAVLGVLCPDGHSNPPQRIQCRVCGAPVAGVPRQIPQPSVGRLVASTGEAFELTGTVVAGRAPRASASHGTGARLLALPYGHISGSHLEIQVEGWSVLARDLSSTNGTFLRRGAQPPVRLPEVPIPIFQGDTLDFGDGVRITFENLP